MKIPSRIIRFVLLFFVLNLFTGCTKKDPVSSVHFSGITLIGQPQVIMSNAESKHNYFAWPTACRLQNGKIAVVASGYRLEHVCPFGQCVISYSEDDGETYSLPAAVIDTVLDDRDGGILAFGEKNVIVTSFNNTVAFQRERGTTPYQDSYLDTITPEEESNALGSLYRISTDGGVTFGSIQKSPVTSPHGPCYLSDGSVLWVGTAFDGSTNDNAIQVYVLDTNGSMIKQGEIENIPGYLSSEPYAVEANDGTIICHIRVQAESNPYQEKFTIYQSESIDSGKTWTVPHQILDDTGGAPSHILKHSSGTLISTYGVRSGFYGINAMLSFDNGKTWEKDHLIYDNNGQSNDLGYASTVELTDGSLATIFYARPTRESPAVILQQKWTF